jgi:putative sterol carrier protein
MATKISSVKEYFDTLPTRFKPDAAKGLKAVFQFELSGDGGGAYSVSVDETALKIDEGTHSAPSITVKMAANDYVKMVNGELNGQMAFMTGKLKVSGNMMLAMKMQQLFPTS